MLGAEVNRERRGILIDETAEAAGHLLAAKVGLEMGLHVVLARHLLPAEQARKLSLAVGPQRRFRAVFKRGNACNSISFYFETESVYFFTMFNIFFVILLSVD